MPLLAGLLVGLFSELVKVFTVYVTKKTALGLAGVAVTLALTGALIAGAKLLLITVLLTIPSSTYLYQGFAMVMPSNFIACIMAIISAHTGVALYRWNMENLKLMAYVT